MSPFLHYWKNDKKILISAKDDFFLWEEAGVFYFQKEYVTSVIEKRNYFPV